jgi:hypothetical protein
MMEDDRSSGLNTEALTGPDSRTSRTRIAFRARGLRNLLRMGHCAPSVMKTILEICGSEEEWPVKLAGGLPGGIGDTGFECGGITSPLILFGLRYGLTDLRNGLPLVFYLGHDHLRHFLDRNHTPLCREIRGDNYRLTRCIRAVCWAPEIAASAFARTDTSAIEGERLEAYSLLYAHMAAEGFHCSHQVLQRLSPVIPVGRELLDATSGYAGGTMFTGMTCSAYAAGVMALGLRMCEIEDSLPRVVRMIVLMKTGGDAFADPINKFNKVMNLGNRLGRWFTGEFGNTQCQSVTGCDFSSPAGARKYIETGGLARCRDIADKVADQVLRFPRLAGPRGFEPRSDG